jgi:hypothetical protein
MPPLPRFWYVVDAALRKRSASGAKLTSCSTPDCVVALPCGR